MGIIRPEVLTRPNSIFVSRDPRMRVRMYDTHYTLRAYLVATGVARSDMKEQSTILAANKLPKL